MFLLQGHSSRSVPTGDMFCGAKHDIFAFGKFDIILRCRISICCLTATRSPNARRAYRSAKRNIDSRREISKIPQGIYIAANKKCHPVGWHFIVSNQPLMGSEGSAAGGRYSDLSEWLRSIKSRISVSPKILSGTATGTPVLQTAKEGIITNRRSHLSFQNMYIGLVQKTSL